MKENDEKIILIMVLVVLNIFAEQKNYVLVEDGSFDDGDSLKIEAAEDEEKMDAVLDKIFRN